MYSSRSRVSTVGVADSVSLQSCSRKADFVLVFLTQWGAALRLKSRWGVTIDLRVYRNSTDTVPALWMVIFYSMWTRNKSRIHTFWEYEQNPHSSRALMSVCIKGNHEYTAAKWHPNRHKVHTAQGFCVCACDGDGSSFQRLRHGSPSGRDTSPIRGGK